MQWSEMIAALNAWGVSKAAIARKLDVAKSTVSDLANGINTDPRWSNGDALIQLHRDERRRYKRRKRAG
jgi:IS30 family transposase